MRASGSDRSTRSRLRAVGLIAVLSATSLAVGANARAQQDDPPDLTATQVSPTERITTGKSLSSRLAETSPDLLGRGDATPVEVVVKLDYDSIATYQGTVDGLAATSPSVTGESLDVTSAAVEAYEGFVVEQENAFLDQLAAAVPDALIGQSLRTVYGGVALTIPANAVADVLAIPNVVAVQTDVLHQPLTDSSGEWIGADAIYDQVGSASDAGQGVIFGVLDSGGWPEHLSYADQGNLSAPPAKADGTARACDFGDNPLTPAVDVFACTKKLIGGDEFLTGYLSNPARAAAEPYPDSARDSDGHGTHTGTTAAGNVIPSATVFGVERGPVAGIAPGAWVSVYKVCGIQGCFGSDTSAAVGQAILDGVDVINYSISGGEDPFTDPTELAFLDAYAAGVFVAASAGNSGPGAATVAHVSPWVTTVAASTQQREFRSTLSLTAADGDTLELFGASITAGVDPALPVVLAPTSPADPRGRCLTAAAPGTYTGKIVACERGGNGRVQKGYNVVQGGAAGMILYNPTFADIETDNHWLPTVHLADGTEFRAFMAANTGVTASFTAGEKADGQGDVLAAFSSKGPGGNFIKPDITAPGVSILAGHTPTPDTIDVGPPGEYFQAIAGTSMSSPHVAGSALLIKALNPDLLPGQIKSVLMTTANWEDQLLEDAATPAGAFAVGAGRVDLTSAPGAGLAISATAADMFAFGNDPDAAIDLNLPSIYVQNLAGSITTRRTVTNVTDRQVRYELSAMSPDGSSISVSPSRIAVPAGESATLEITIDTSATSGDYEGIIFMEPRTRGVSALHLPVAFTAQQGSVSLISECEPESIAVRVQGTPAETSECTILAQNNSPADTSVDLTTTVSRELRLLGVEGATPVDERTVSLEADLLGTEAGVPAVDPGAGPAGYIPLSLFGVAPDAIGDEDIINYNVPPWEYNGVTYTSVGVDSNGYLIAGGGTSEDNNCCNLPDGPDPAPPNNILAPFWTDLDGTGAAGIYAATLTDGVNTWLVVEYQVNVFGTTSNRHFQVWIGVNGTQDISFAYDPAALPADPAGQDFLVGAENENGEGDVTATLPTEDLVVTSSDPTPGGAASYKLTVDGRRVGTGVVETSMISPAVAGSTRVRSEIDITE